LVNTGGGEGKNATRRNPKTKREEKGKKDSGGVILNPVTTDRRRHWMSIRRRDRWGMVGEVKTLQNSHAASAVRKSKSWSKNVDQRPLVLKKQTIPPSGLRRKKGLGKGNLCKLARGSLGAKGGRKRQNGKIRKRHDWRRRNVQPRDCSENDNDADGPGRITQGKGQGD